MNNYQLTIDNYQFSSYRSGSTRVDGNRSDSITGNPSRPMSFFSQRRKGAKAQRKFFRFDVLRLCIFASLREKRYAVEQKNINVGQKRINVEQKNINVGQKYINVGQKRINVGQKRINVGQKYINVGQKYINVGQKNINVDQKNINVGQKNIGVYLKSTVVHHKTPDRLELGAAHEP